MNPPLEVILRTLKSSLEEHVIPELDSSFARGQAGQVAVTLEWLAEGLEEPMQTVRDGNLTVRQALEALSGQLQALAKTEATQSDRWKRANETLQAVLDAPCGDTLAGEQDRRHQYFKVLDDLVITIGVPQGPDEVTGPVWAALQQALVALAAAETTMGPVPLPQHHWR